MAVVGGTIAGMRIGVILGGPVLALVLAGCAEPGADTTGGARQVTVIVSATATRVPSAALPPCTWAQVTRIVDGDTIGVTIEGKADTVRYIGVDTPELGGGAPQPFAAAATDYNRKLVGGQRVCLERDVSDRDRFQRLLRYVWLEDGTMVNEALLAAGLASVATFPPDVKYIEPRFLPAQQRAREAKVGLWAATAAGGDAPACYSPGVNTCDCGDFATQVEAQRFHDTYDAADVNRLDSDGNGRVCESLP